MSAQPLDISVTSPMKPSSCCECGHSMTHASGPSQPDEGDFTLCIRCSSLNVFAADLSLRAPTVAEVLKSAADSDLQTMRRAILSIPKERRE